MVNYPNDFDDDTTLPYVGNNITEIGADVINALREVIFNIEQQLGLNVAGTLTSLNDRLAVSTFPDGTIKPSALTGIGLVTLPITNIEISPTANIDESKLALSYSTYALHTDILDLRSDVDYLQGINTITVSKVEPHIAGTDFKHNLSAIDVDSTASIKNQYGLLRDNTNSLTLVEDLNSDFVKHQKADGVNSTTVAPINFAHNASGINVETSNFTFIPQTNDSVQKVVDFVDQSSLFLLGTRTQTLYSNGIPRSARASDLDQDGYGQIIVPSTPVITYLLNNNSSVPVDDITVGDDVILFNPTSNSNKVFDAQFSQVKSGDIIIVNYGSLATRFVIDSVKHIVNGSNTVYSVRIAGKNLIASEFASAVITKPLFTDEKYGVLSTAAANPPSSSYYGSLIVGNPRSASVLGIGFNASRFNATHYNLYLTLYPNGQPTDKAITLPAIDVTGNQGTTPGSYTLDSIVEATNIAFRNNGYNFRFIAYSYKGEFGIMLADSYQNASFSITSGPVDTNGNYTSSGAFPNNVVDNYSSVDPLGFGSGKANVASPPYAASYASSMAASVPTLVFAPLSKKFYYVNGVEKERVNQTIQGYEELTLLDEYGDGYWIGELTSKTIQTDRISITYTVNADLSSSGLKPGKTIVIQPNILVTDPTYSVVDYGRFYIDSVSYNNCDTVNGTTTITLYDAVHGTGVSPYVSSAVGLVARLHFTDDSVGFDTGNVSDSVSQVPYKRYFEILSNGTTSQSGEVFSHERARFLKDSSGSFNINFHKVSPKLKGFTVGSKKIIGLSIQYNTITGIFSGFLLHHDGITQDHYGPTVSGKKGDIVRFYDETNIDYIDFIFDINDSIPSFGTTLLDIELFPSLALDEELMLISTCQVSDETKKVSHLRDDRQFGNVSEKILTTSALDYISASDKLLRENGIISGFELTTGTNLNSDNKIGLKGGVALVNGKIINVNENTYSVPVLNETIYPSFVSDVTTIRWYMCLNDKGDVEFIASTDYDLALASTYGTLDHNRLFYVKNPNSTSTSPYVIKSTYFEKLVMEYKDLVPLYVVTATCSTIVSSGTVEDVRRYTQNGFTGQNDVFTLGTLANFKTIAPIQTCIKELTYYKSYSTNSKNRVGKTIKVKDNVNVTGLTLDFPVKTKFIGDGGRLLTDGLTTLTKNIELYNLDIDTTGTTYGISLLLTGSDITIDSCNIIGDYDATSDGVFTAANLCNPQRGLIHCVNTATIKNIKITNNNFTSTRANRFAFVNLLSTTEASYYENVDISNNTFTTTAASDDKRAVIVISSTLTSNPTVTSGPRIVNINISNNNCNKNQLITLTSQLDSGTARNMLVPINVNISNNICGAICYMTKQDISSATYNVSSNIDKNNMINIFNNTCKYIYCGFNDGFIGGMLRNIYNIVSGQNVYSGSANIKNNVCSWIQVGNKTPTSYAYETPSCNVVDNKITAYPIAFLSDYYNGPSPSNIAIIVDEQAGT